LRYVYTGEFVTVRTFFLVSVFALALQSAAGLAQSVATTSLPTASASAAMPIPAPPGLAAKSYLLIDYNTGKVIAEHNSNERLPPASLTKMMTAYLVSSEMKFRGLVVQSGNDASIALAEHVGGSEEGFVSMMNQMSQRLGMNDTHFTNSTGLPGADHYTTARDMAVLARAVIRDHPNHYKLYSVREFEFNGIKQKNRNTLLLRDETVDGIKTGHTEAAGYCLVASAQRGNMRLISVLLGARNEQLRSTESLRALNYGFRFYETVKLADATKQLGNAKVWGGAVDNVTLGVKEEKFVTLPTGQGSGIVKEMHLARDLIAPIAKGQELGVLKVMLENKLLAELPIVSTQAVERGGFFTRTTDTFKRLLN